MGQLSRLDTANPMDIAAEVWQELPAELQRSDTYSEISALAHNRDYGALAQILSAAQELRPNITYTDARQVHIHNHYNPVITATTTTNHNRATGSNSGDAMSSTKAWACALALVGLLWVVASRAGSEAGEGATRNYLQDAQNYQMLAPAP